MVVRFAAGRLRDGYDGYDGYGTVPQQRARREGAQRHRGRRQRHAGGAAFGTGTEAAGRGRHGP
ncbi:hypothetical protein ACH5BA_11180 [Kitasatospora sp. NPDC018623]